MDLKIYPLDQLWQRKSLKTFLTLSLLFFFQITHMSAQCPNNISTPNGCPTAEVGEIDGSGPIPSNFCVNPSDGGCGTIRFINLPPTDPTGCQPQICFKPSQGCGVAGTNLCLYSSDGMGGCNFISVGSSDAEICLPCPPGATEFEITICRPGMGPVSAQDLYMTSCCTFEADCPVVTDLGAFDCTSLGNIPACPTDEASVEAAPYNFTIGDEPCGVIEVTCVDDISNYDVCAAGGQTVTRTITVFDDLNDNQIFDAGSEESETCTYTFDILEDTTPPMITCPTNVTVECDQPTDPNATGMATATDACDSAPVIAFSDVSTQGQGCAAYSYIITRTWTATDACGNIAACTQIVTVEDNNPPTIACPADVTVECDQPTDPGATGNAVASDDNCAPNNELTVVFSDVSTQTPTGCGNDSYTITRTWTASDPCGNATNCVQIIDVEDTTPPMITCPTNVTVECDQPTDPNATGMATATDACDSAPVIAFSDVSTQGQGCAAYSYIITRTWTATDACGNIAACTQIVTVEDNNPPTIACPADVTVECDQPTDPGATGNAVASDDNCAPNNELTVVFSDVSTQTPTGCGNDSYTITRTWTASDPCGNVANCVQVITVEDTTPPTIVCPANVTIECDEDTSPANTGMAVATDVCAPAAEIVIDFSDVSTQTASGCGQYQYTITRTWTATDPCGNATNCVQIIEVEDTTAPEIVCPADVSLSCTDSTDPADNGIATGSDNCSTVAEVVITSSDISTQTNEGCGKFTYEIFRTWLATDACGNTTTCVQNLAVADTEAPVITCPPSQTLSCFETVPTPYMNAADYIAGGGTITDNCTMLLTDFTVFSQDADNGGDNCPGNSRIVVRTYFVQDACGNTTTCEQTFTYLASTQGPVITSVLPTCYKYCASLANPMEEDITYDTDCSFGASVNFTGPQQIGQDNCPGTIYRYTYTVTDDCGRTSAPVTRDFIIGNDGPTIECAPFNLILECGDPDNQDYIDTHLSLFEVNTACELGYTVNYFPQNFNLISCASSTVVTFVATDACGRTASCTTTIAVQDNTPPTFTAVPPSVCDEIDCSADINYWYNHWIDYMEDGLEAEDACDTNVSIQAVNTPVNTDCPNGDAVTVVTFVATDNCGNEAEITGTFTVTATPPPSSINVMGQVATEEGETVENVRVTLEGPNNYTDLFVTGEDGIYGFENLLLGGNYEVTPFLDEDPLNGISSFDLVLMTKHILQLQMLDSPYKIIAADVNNSGSVSTSDIVALRKMILHIDEAFDNNTSWRFVEGAYVFPNANNPFATTFPQEIFINGLTAGEEHDFVGVKIGDVNGSVAANAPAGADSRTFDGQLNFGLKNRELEVGKTYDVEFLSDNFVEVMGYQFTLNFDATQIEFEGIEAGILPSMTESNFGLSKLSEGIITTSWTNQKAVTMMDDATLFTLRFTAKANTTLSDVLSLSSRYTAAEAYRKVDTNSRVALEELALRFDTDEFGGARFELHQNAPNPFADETMIGFNLPSNSNATITVYDISGRILKQIEGDYTKGYHTVAITKDELKGSTGILYYELATPTQRATKKMTLIRR